jgi:ectoine hydroxylase-related dioxygenase (phytanoyl-CoA dioxygenase family)
MPKCLSEETVQHYSREGFYFPIRVLSDDEVRYYRGCLEASEAQHGEAITGKLRAKPHLLWRWANQLIRHPRILDAVEDVLGPNILCWGSSFFNKSAHDPAYVSWHQDATYWGLEPHDVLTAWIALSDVPISSGAMQFVRASHALAQIPHHDTFHADNMLSRGQVVDMEIDASQVVDVPLQAGEMSLHHVHLVHGSAPNTSQARRIGFAIRYMAPHVRQTMGSDTATLVRGEDPYGHFTPEPVPQADLDAAALAAHQAVLEQQRKILYRGVDQVHPRG